MVQVCVGDMTPEEAGELTRGAAVELLTHRVGVRHDVAPNGTCWLYAVMAAMRILEHEQCSQAKRAVRPSALDVRSSEILLKAMRKHFLSLRVPTKPKRNQKNWDYYETYWHMSEQLAKQNVWVTSMRNNNAEFGTESMHTLLARTLDRTIIVLDGATMAGMRSERSATATGLTGEAMKHLVHAPQSTRLSPKLMNTIGVLIHLESDKHALVVEHVNGDHFVGLALAGVAPDALPRCLTDASAALARDYRQVLMWVA